MRGLERFPCHLSCLLLLEANGLLQAVSLAIDMSGWRPVALCL